MNTYMTSESVSSGHPDKLCDQISDAILDECLKNDPNSRVACETMVTTGTVIVAGEITTKANIDYQAIVRDTLNEIGYNSSEACFSGDDVGVHILINKQSPDIAVGVDSGGAGDQGIMFGYATNETDSYMPYPIYYAHLLAKKLEEVRKKSILPYLLPDGKTQVTVEYKDNTPIRIDTIIISNQHKSYISQEELIKGIKKEVIEEVLKGLIDEKTKIFINPTGIFQIGGPKGDCGLTGRKIIIDTYGGVGRHGGGAFSGKDPSKVDRSGAYIARYLAKNIVASGICEKCEVQLSYGIGIIDPTSIFIDCFGTNKVNIQNIIEAINKNFDLSQNGIIQKLDLKKPIYKKTAAYGHFGRDDVSWENLDSINIFKKLMD